MPTLWVPPDDARTGRHPMRTLLLPATATVDPSTEQQAVSFAGPDGTYAQVTGYGYQRVATEPGEVFTEPFDGVIDTIDRWTTGGTVAPTATGGVGNINVGATTVSASSTLVSKPTFSPRGLNFRTLGLVARFESISAATGTLFYLNNHRFIGLAVPPGTFQATIGVAGTSGPVLDGIGFEIATDGNMYAVVYANGVRSVAPVLDGGTTLNTNRALANGALHQFAIVIRSDAIFWYIDGITTPAAAMSYASGTYALPATQTLPIRLHSINNTTAASGIPLMQVSAIALADTGQNGSAIVDGVYPWREARVTDVTGIAGALQYSARELWAGSALNVNTNAIQVPTYRATAKPAAAALVASTLSLRVSLHHTAAAVKTVRIRRIIVAALMSGVIEAANIEVHKITAAPTGTVVTAGAASGTAAGANMPVDTRDATPEAVLNNSLTAATSVGLLCSAFVAQSSVAALHGGGVIVYDWNDSGQAKPITLRSGVLEGIAVGIISSAAVTPTLSVEILYTEE